MPDLEQRIREGLDRLTDRPDPARVLGQVGRRKRRLRVVHRVQTVALVVAVLAGVGGGTYALSRAFGVGAARHVPNSTSTPSNAPHVSPSASPPPSPSASPSGIAMCSDQTAKVTVANQSGAAGTIRTVWQVTNTGQAPCRSFGYPGMDFHASSGWLNVQIHRGGFGDINGKPTSVVVQPGGSLYFVSYWSDVTTNVPCSQFDRVKVTLPGNRVSAQVTSLGCVNLDSVDVGPVTSTKPQ